jgi:uncharacterized protein (TIGR00369 family)
LDPKKAAKVRAIFDHANFMRSLGFELAAIEDGWCEMHLTPGARHQQQHGLIHAGVLATMADHTAGCAARGAVGLDQDVLSIEFKINFLRPAVGDRLRCRSTVLRAGRTVAVSESEVYARQDGREKLVAKATVTLAVVDEANLRLVNAQDATPSP